MWSWSLESASRWESSAIVVALASALGCSSTTVDSPAARPAPAPQERETQAQVEPPDEVRVPERLVPGRLHYDLASHIERAEVWRGESLLMDHGVDGGAKYTLGGWLTSVSASQELDGTTAAIMTGTRGRFLLPYLGSGPALLTMRVRAIQAAELRLYLNGEELSAVEVPRDEAFHVLQVPVPPERVRQGENTLLVRVRRTGNLAGVRNAGLAVDWMTLGAADDPSGPPPAPGELARALDGQPALHLPSGIRLGYALEVPERARLRGIARSQQGASLEVVAHRDGSPPATLQRVAASSQGELFDIDLEALIGRVSRLDLVAVGGDVSVIRPSIVTLHDDVATESQPRVRNVLVYLIDTLRADKLTPYNPSSRVLTPGLMRFVETAATFTRAHTQENWTKPSVATLLSSLMPWQHTAVSGDSVVPASVEMLPEILSERGFYTGSFIANGYVSDRFGFKQGWDTYRNYIREGRRTPAQYVAADVLQWLDSRPADDPFFLYVHTIDPHVPYRPPDEFLAMYEQERYRGPLSFRRDATLLENVKSGRIRVNARDRAHLAALYDGEISYHDVHFNSIMEGLERRGLAEDTLVVVTSDHGEEFWDHGSVGHGHNVYEELLHIPMFVRVPGLTDGAVRLDTPMGLVDVMPTVLDVLGQEVPEGLAGQSLLPQLLGLGTRAPRYTVSGFMENWRTIVVGRTKLIHRTNRQVMLYDLVDDPGEQQDIAEEHPIAVRYARGLLGLALQESSPAAPVRRRRRGRAHQAETVTIDPVTEAQLRALGYVGTSRR